jgi:non-heme chloroperoxidase
MNLASTPAQLALPAICGAVALSLLSLLTSGAGQETSTLSSLYANGVELHYIDSGTGTAVVFVHGGLADYRELSPVAEALSSRYRTVVYSRRHSFPNDNPPAGADEHMLREVADLAALIEALKLAPAHIAGTSYGGFVALMLALERPELVRSITAAEPPLLHLLSHIEGGKPAHDEFFAKVMYPSQHAFAAGQAEQALRVAMDYFVGPGGLDVLPVEVQEMLRGNIEDWHAITSAPGALPKVSYQRLSAITSPVLILSGGASAAVHRLIDPELLRILPNATRMVIDEGTHEMCVELPKECARAVDRFIRGR